MNSDKASNENDAPPPKHHTITVCMVPPMEAASVWETVTRARMELKDPGFYRWPPHANLLYPFVSLKKKKTLQEENEMELVFVRKLRNATRQCEPFQVTLDRFGTFGGKQQGVLWVYPTSFRTENQQQDREPIIELQSLLEEEFPYCKDQRKQGGRFTPHITLSHFPDLAQAQAAQLQVESWWPASSCSYTCSEIYVLERKGDEGQFQRLVTLRLGKAESDNGFEIHDPPLAFPAMPTKEDEWVHEERMKLKERRNNSWSRRGRGTRRRTKKGDYVRSPSRSTETHEEIAAKRAARKAKRMLLAKEALAGKDKEGEALG